MSTFFALSNSNPSALREPQAAPNSPEQQQAGDLELWFGIAESVLTDRELCMPGHGGLPWFTSGVFFFSTSWNTVPVVSLLCSRSSPTGYNTEGCYLSATPRASLEVDDLECPTLLVWERLPFAEGVSNGISPKPCTDYNR